MKNNDYNVKSVEFNYNGNIEKFNCFLSAVMKDYISVDKASPSEDENNNDTAI